jgi:hypothetical protein
MEGCLSVEKENENPDEGTECEDGDAGHSDEAERNFPGDFLGILKVDDRPAGVFLHLCHVHRIFLPRGIKDLVVRLPFQSCPEEGTFPELTGSADCGNFIRGRFPNEAVEPFLLIRYEYQPMGFH